MKMRSDRMRKESNVFFFSVEGSTEKWYLDWLQQKINSDPTVTHTIKLKTGIQKDSCKYVKLEKNNLWFFNHKLMRKLLRMGFKSPLGHLHINYT